MVFQGVRHREREEDIPDSVGTNNQDALVFLLQYR